MDNETHTTEHNMDTSSLIEQERDGYGWTRDGVISLAKTAYDRGFHGRTFATADESRHPVHDAAWALGAEYRNGRVREPHCLLGCGCPACRLARVVAYSSTLHAGDEIDEIVAALHA